MKPSQIHDKMLYAYLEKHLTEMMKTPQARGITYREKRNLLDRTYECYELSHESKWHYALPRMKECLTKIQKGWVENAPGTIFTLYRNGDSKPQEVIIVKREIDPSFSSGVKIVFYPTSGEKELDSPSAMGEDYFNISKNKKS